MKLKSIFAFGILAMVLVAAALIAALLSALREADESSLHIHLLSSNTDTNGSQTATFMVTNASTRVFPWLATTTLDGQAPYYVLETKTEEGWRRTTPFTNYWFSHHLLAHASWEIELSLAASERPRRVILFYTVGQRARPWLVDAMHKLLKNLTLEKDAHELRSAILQSIKSSAANASQPVPQETSRTSSAAGSGR